MLRLAFASDLITVRIYFRAAMAASGWIKNLDELILYCSKDLDLACV